LEKDGWWIMALLEKGRLSSLLTNHDARFKHL